MAVRKEMLERELRKLGFRKPDGPAAHAQQQQQQPQHGTSSHPQAGGAGDGEGHAD